MTIRDLHRLAYAFLPRGQVHELLHDYAAQKFAVASLTQCNAWQLERIADWVRSHPSPVTGQLETGNRKPETRRRVAPRGRTPREGVTLAASPAQWQRIKILIEQICGGPGGVTKEQLVAYARRFLKQVLGSDLAWPDQSPTPAELDELLQGVLTSQAAQRVISAATVTLKRRGLWRERSRGLQPARSLGNGEHDERRSG